MARQQKARPLRALRKPIGRRHIGETARAHELRDDADCRHKQHGGGDTKADWKAGEERRGAAPNRKKVEQEPFACPGLGYKILYARCRRLAEHRTVAFEPGEKRDDLVELRKAQPLEPAKND